MKFFDNFQTARPQGFTGLGQLSFAPELEALFYPERAPTWSFEVSRSSPDYIRWIQQSLNRIMGLRLVVDGIKGVQTNSAVRRFQQQAGLVVDSIVGPQTEAALIAAGASRPPSTGTAPSPGTSSSVNTPLPRTGPGFYNKHCITSSSSCQATRSYGTQQTIQALIAIGRAWQKAHPDRPRIGIGDISLQGGGPMDEHDGHRWGKEADIRPMRNDGQEAAVGDFRSATYYSRILTQQLVNLIHANRVAWVETIYFNDPQITGVNFLDGHYDHLHVRFY